MTFCLNRSVLFLLALGVCAAAKAEDSTGRIPYQHAIQATQTCNACHEQSRVKMFNSTMANDCEECHDSGEKSPIVRVKTSTSPTPMPTNSSVAPAERHRRHERADVLQRDPHRQGPNPMALIPAGKFLRGSNNRMPDEGPQYTAETKAFWIDKYEVTNLSTSSS